MADKTEEQIAAEKAAVASLRGAKANIETVLARCVTLENALRVAGENLRHAKNYVGERAYIYGTNGPTKAIRDHLEDQAQAALKLVG